MTRDQQLLAAWGGGALVALIVAGLWISSRADDLATTRGEAERSHARYRALYVDGAGPLSAEQGLAQAADLAERQEAELRTAEAALVPKLAQPYQPASLNDAAAQVTRDYSRIKQVAQSRGVKLQQNLPFETGIDADDAKRALQLAQLSLIAKTLDLALEHGAKEISSVSVDRAGSFRDASGTYATLICEISVFGTYQGSEGLLQALRARHGEGIGVRGVDLEQSDQDLQRMRLTVSLLTANNPAWQLPEEGKAAKATTGPRLGARLGG